MDMSAKQTNITHRDFDAGLGPSWPATQNFGPEDGSPVAFAAENAAEPLLGFLV